MHEYMYINLKRESEVNTCMSIQYIPIFIRV
jgi:hypothetical protein